MHKVVVLGECAVGKSGLIVLRVVASPRSQSFSCFAALTMQYVRHQFVDYHNPTLGEHAARLLILA